MTDGVNIDWSLMGPQRDYVGDYTNAFQVGRALAGQGIQGKAFTGYEADPAATVDGLAQLTPAQRAIASDRADILANMALGLKARPYGERAAILAHIAPDLAAHGIAPDMVSAFDATDENLDGVAASARSLIDALASSEAQGREPPEYGDRNESSTQPGADRDDMPLAEFAR